MLIKFLHEVDSECGEDVQVMAVRLTFVETAYMTGVSSYDERR